MKPWHRRDVLRTLAAGAIAGCSSSRSTVCIVGVSRGSSGYCLVEAEPLRVPNAANLGKGEAKLLNVDDNTAVIVARDDNGFFALSAICTHQCCLLALCNNVSCSDLATNPGDCKTTVAAMPSTDQAALICACHGSAFRLDGSVANGPATRPLPHYAVQLDGADALVDTSQAVDPATRTAA